MFLQEKKLHAIAMPAILPLGKIKSISKTKVQVVRSWKQSIGHVVVITVN